MKHKDRFSKINRLLKDLDWDCKDHLHHLTSLNVLHWFPASFITAIPGNVIDIFSKPGNKVWDPFCGSGTTAIECYRKGRYFYGNDISEIGIMITESKLTLLKHRHTIELLFNKVLSEILKIAYYKSFNISFEKYIKKALKLSNIENIAPWYSKEILSDLLILRGYIETLEIENDFKQVLIVLFLNVAKIACAQNKTWGHIADNVLPDEKQIAEKKGDVIQTYKNKLLQILDKIKKILVIKEALGYTINVADARSFSPPSHVDLVVTSPPYPSMADYITSQRLDYYWLGRDVQYINDIKKMEIGARYLRHNKNKNIMYLENMILCCKNIVGNIKKYGVFVLVLPKYKQHDKRKDVIEKLVLNINSTCNLEYKIERKIDDKYRWAPFRKLNEELLYIWRKK